MTTSRRDGYRGGQRRLVLTVAGIIGIAGVTGNLGRRRRNR